MNKLYNGVYYVETSLNVLFNLEYDIYKYQTVESIKFFRKQRCRAGILEISDTNQGCFFLTYLTFHTRRIITLYLLFGHGFYLFKETVFFQLNSL